jgi:hypothetical protein
MRHESKTRYASRWFKGRKQMGWQILFRAFHCVNSGSMLPYLILIALAMVAVVELIPE